MKFMCSNLEELKEAVKLATNDGDRITIVMKDLSFPQRTHTVTFIIEKDKFICRDFGFTEK